MNETQSHTRRVLVADDVDVLSELIEAILEGDGFTVQRAHDGEECLSLIDEFRPDLIILDLMMPKIHGLDILKQLKNDPPKSHIGVIICSTKTFKTEIDQAYELGAFDFLAKPFQEQELLRMVHLFFTTGMAQTKEGAKHIQQAIEGEIFRPQIENYQGCFRLWGTRGSIPISGPRYVRHGGNTTCFEVECDDHRIIFDAGSGIRDLGIALLSERPQTLHIFITHTHWDHIQGFPFFTPAFIPGYEINLYASPNLEKDIKSIFQGQLDRAYFPVQMEDMQARLNFYHFEEAPTFVDSSVEIGGMKVSWEYMVHPGATVGYKIQIGDKTLAFVPDNEFLKGYLGPPHDITLNHNLAAINGKIINFLSGVDVLIHECQYTNEEYLNKIGWGHSSVSNACALVKLTQPKKWIVTHHEPMHDDDFLMNKLNLTKQLLASMDTSVPVIHAYDGMTEYI